MKIFISHASANKEYGNALVDLLRGVGLKEDEIIFTSNTAYGIPTGQNIFNWLKAQITDKPFVIYLLSKEYYESIACLNEMGAAWVIENEHAILFTPNFDITSREFQNGAIDPREIGFKINDEDRLLSFIYAFEQHFAITKSPVLINQHVKKYLSEIGKTQQQPAISSPEEKSTIIKEISLQEHVAKIPIIVEEKAVSPGTTKSSNNPSSDPYQRFLHDITNNKLKDPELLLLHYVIDMSRSRLFTGWQEDQETNKITEWEEVNELNNTLSSNYKSILSKFEIRRYTDVSAITASGNPKEVKLKTEIEDHILYLSSDVMSIIQQAIDRNKNSEDEDDSLPF